MEQASERPTFSVVIPVHNEASYIPTALPRLYEELSRVPAEVTVLLVENGSTDDTAALVKEMAPTYPGLGLMELPDPDYGGAMRSGFLAGDGDWIVNFDIDYFSGEFLRQVLDIGGDADLVLASKRAEGSDDRRPWIRRLATRVFNLVLRFGLGSGVSDTHGMKAVRREVVQDVAPDVISTKDLFDTELVVRAERKGYRIREVPVVVEELRDAKSSLLKRVPRTLAGVWRIRQALRRGS